jgi:hypothetical protein
LTIAAVAITHKKRIGGTFVAHPTAKAASRKSSSHSFYSLLVRQFLAPLLSPIAREIDGIRARADEDCTYHTPVLDSRWVNQTNEET